MLALPRQRNGLPTGNKLKARAAHEGNPFMEGLARQEAPSISAVSF